MHVQYIGDVPSADASQAPKLEVSVYVTEAVVEGDYLVIDTAVTTNGLGVHAKKSTVAAGGAGEGIGGALYSAPSGGLVRVRTQGVQDNVKVDTGVAAEAILVNSQTTAGALMTQSGTYAVTHRPKARALTAESGNRATVFWNTGFGGNIA